MPLVSLHARRPNELATRCFDSNEQPEAFRVLDLKIYYELSLLKTFVGLITVWVDKGI